LHSVREAPKQGAILTVASECAQKPHSCGILARVRDLGMAYLVSIETDHRQKGFNRRRPPRRIDLRAEEGSDHLTLRDRPQ
jgi:hypothetical protein